MLLRHTCARRAGAGAARASHGCSAAPVQRTVIGWAALVVALVVLAAPMARASQLGAGAEARTVVNRRAGGGFTVDAARRLDRRSMAGAAGRAHASGIPDPIPGLANPDTPAVGAQPVKTATMEDLVLPYGYPLESYPVETQDGFILRVYRIPHGKKNATSAGPRPAVLLHHGITLASSCFVVLDTEASMGFYLADAGFDVWMANARGNTYSRGNRYYRSTDYGYWQFSMDEPALLDLPAQVDFVLGLTGQSRLALIGHSQGATLPLMMLSARPEYNDKLWLLVTMGGVAQNLDVATPFLRQQINTRSPQVLSSAGIGQFIPHQVVGRISKGCEGAKVNKDWCYAFIVFTFYGPSDAIDTDDISRVGATWPSTVGTRNMLHWSQMLRDERGMAMYDFGSQCPAADTPPVPFQESCNLAKYGEAEPPRYDLSRVTVKAAVLHGLKDVMATTSGRDKLLAAWGADVVYKKDYPETAHMDFIWARNPVMKNDVIDVLWAHAPRVE